MGSRDLSIISTPPPNRQPIETQTHIFDEELIREAIELELARNGQVYYLHNRIEDMAKIERLIAKLCPKARIAVAHGQMEAARLERTIMDFIYGEFDVLLCTTIVENGIDIPNANTIIIDNAQNFGLSDLHQLRGRVGRSSRKGYCYLLSPPDELLSSDARRRLRAIEEFSELGSGFNIAMQDLDIRGTGNLLGAEQSGFIADIGFETYQKILAEAVEELRNEGIYTDREGEDDTKPLAMPSTFISDSHIEIDVEAYIPESYVQQSAEKIKLYRELDSLTDTQEFSRFSARLIDRFGPIPQPAQTLIDVVRLRREAIRLGFERVKVKNGLMLLYFLSDKDSAYFKGRVFSHILEHISAHSEQFVLKQNNNKLFITVRNIKDVAAGVGALQKIRVN